MFDDMLEGPGGLLLATTGVMFLLTLFLFALTIVFNTRRYKDHKRMLFLKTQHEKAMMAAKLRIQELTLQVISREIHDNVQHNLVVSKAQLDNLDEGVDEKAKVVVKSSSALIGETIDNLNSITKVLDSDIIKSIGLMHSLSTEINRINISGLFTVNAKFSGTIQKIPEDKELSIFRIVQEVFSNVIKHSNAKVVDLSLEYCPKHVELTIYDNGVGFDYLSGQKAKLTSGLTNIKTRTRLMKGKMNIQSSGGKGTSVWISIPYEDTIEDFQTIDNGSN